MHILPLSGMLNENTIDFNVPAQIEHYTDLSRSYLHVKLSVTRTDGKSIDAGGKIKLIPLFVQSLWRQIDLQLNGTLVSTSSNQAAYRSYIETILSYPKNVQSDQLSVLEHLGGYTCVCRKDLEFVKDLARPNLNVMQQNRYPLNGLPLSIRPHRNTDGFIFNIARDVATPEV